MAFHWNKCEFGGRIACDMEPPRTTKNGRMVNFRLVVGKSKKDQQTGEWIDDPDTLWQDCVFFGGEKTDWLIDLIAERGVKGANVFVAGKMTTETWDDKQTGQKRSKQKLIVSDIQFLDPRDGGTEQQPQQRGVQQQRPQQGGYQQRPQSPQRGYQPAGYGGGDDDRPF